LAILARGQTAALRDGISNRRGADGKPQYAAILEWKSRDLSDRFSATVIDLIRQNHPNALDGEGEP
jgi:hypothetical protein